CDLLDTPRLRSILQGETIDCVYHLAGSARVDQTIGMPEYFQRNFEATRSLLNCLLEKKGALRIFFASSVHVYGNQSGPIDETTPIAPNGFYGMSKYLCERALEEFSNTRPETQVTVGRLYSCIGPGQGPGFVTSDLTLKLVRLPAEAREIET